MNTAFILSIAGPLLQARTQGPFSLYDAVEVGKNHLLGEVIRLDGEFVTVQVYEDTTGLMPGDTLTSHGLPLSIPLGPGVLGGIFDGLLRPLTGYHSPFVQRGARGQREAHFHFTPQVREGQHLQAGVRIGGMERAGAAPQWLMVPPGVSGTVRHLASEGAHSEDDVLCEIETEQGELKVIRALEHWPIRRPRPVKKRLPSEVPLMTGQRVVDSLFPIALGSKAALPGGFGTGKTVLLETLAKWCSADVIVYVGCGERGNELTGMLEEFPQLVDPRTGRALLERTVIIANTSNMPVAAREASIYTGVTLAEYFRDQGQHVALMADSTSRWAEALREISGRLGELPGEGGYPAYLSSRLADFYERAARVETLGGMQGSVTILGTVSPPSGDLSEPVVSHTKRYVRCMWALDVQRAQARLYPAINPLMSYSEDAGNLDGWWQAQGNDRWLELRRLFLGLLEEQVRLERMARIIGKDALPYRQQFRLLCAELINESFLRQSAYSEIDRFASPVRQTAMLKLIARFVELGESAVQKAIAPQRIIGLPMFRRLQRMGEEIAEDDIEEMTALGAQMEEEFETLYREAEGAALEQA